MSQGDPQPQGQEEVSWGGPGERPGRAGGGVPVAAAWPPCHPPGLLLPPRIAGDATMRLYSLSVLYKGDPKVHLLKAAYDVSTFNFFQRSRWVSGVPEPPRKIWGRGKSLLCSAGLAHGLGRTLGRGSRSFWGSFLPVPLLCHRMCSGRANRLLLRDKPTRDTPLGSCDPTHAVQCCKTHFKRSFSLRNSETSFCLKATHGQQQEVRFDSVNHLP